MKKKISGLKEKTSQFIFRSEAPLQLTLSVCSSVCTPLAVLYITIVYIVYNDSLLFLGNDMKRTPLNNLIYKCVE